MRGLPLILALMGLGSTAFLVDRLAPRPSAPVPRPITGFPLRWEGWQGADRAVSERLAALLETREILYRDYQSAEDLSVLVCVAVAGGNRKVAHPPGICYRGQGWKILDQLRTTWEVAGQPCPVEVLQVKKDERQRLVVSWYRVGERATSSYLEQQWWGLQEDLRGSDLPSALFRFSTAQDPRDPDQAETVLRQFLERFLLPLDEALQRRTTEMDGPCP